MPKRNQSMVLIQELSRKKLASECSRLWIRGRDRNHQAVETETPIRDSIAYYGRLSDYRRS